MIARGDCPVGARRRLKRVFDIKARRDKRAVWYWLWAIGLFCFVAALAAPHGFLFRWEILAGVIAGISGLAGRYGPKRKTRRRDYRNQKR